MSIKWSADFRRSRLVDRSQLASISQQVSSILGCRSNQIDSCDFGHEKYGQNEGYYQRVDLSDNLQPQPRSPQTLLHAGDLLQVQSQVPERDVRLEGQQHPSPQTGLRAIHALRCSGQPVSPRRPDWGVQTL